MNNVLENGDKLVMLIGIIISFLAGAIVMIVFMRVEMYHMRENYNALIEYLGNGRSRNILHELYVLVRNLERNSRVNNEDIKRLYALMSGCVQKVGVIRFNAFHNVGSGQSFSVALLDSDDNGVVFSGIYGRESSTTYAKPINAGVSDYILTEEEEDAIGLARKHFIDAAYFRDD